MNKKLTIIIACYRLPVSQKWLCTSFMSNRVRLQYIAALNYKKTKTWLFASLNYNTERQHKTIHCNITTRNNMQRHENLPFIQPHVVSPPSSFGLDDNDFTRIIRNETKKIFDAIYLACLEKNKAVLDELKKYYLADDMHYVSIILDGETPTSLLAYQGHEEAVDFLLKTVDESNRNRLIQEKKIGLLKKNPELASEYALTPGSYTEFILVSEGFSQIPIEAIHPDHRSEFTAYANACLGQTEEVNKQLLSLESIYSNNYDRCIILTNVGCFYSNHGHHDSANDILKKIKDTYNYGNSMHLRKKVVLACLEGGYLTQFVRFLKSFSRLSLLSFMEDNCFLSEGNRKHYAVMLPILSAMGNNNKDLKETILKNIGVINHPHKNMLLNSAEKINHYIHTYHLDWEQAIAASSNLPILIWVMQGIQLVKQGQLSLDIFIKILTFISDPMLSHEQASTSFDNIYFFLNKDFLIANLDKYLEPFYDENRCHRARANSFRKACDEVSSASNLGQLVAQQHGLFSLSVIGNKNSLRRHEMPLENTTRDDFYGILNKYHNKSL